MMQRYRKRRIQWFALLIETLMLTMPCVSVSASFVVSHSLSTTLKGRNLRKIEIASKGFQNIRSFTDTRLSSSIRHIGIIGGGLAGLSTAYHLLDYSNKTCGDSRNIKITILDQANEPGKMGASSVAGGLLHPLTPRGKLVHLGREGLQITNHLVEEASKFEPSCILRDRLFRIALSPKHVDQLVSIHL